MVIRPIGQACFRLYLASLGDRPLLGWIRGTVWTKRGGNAEDRPSSWGCGRDDG